MSRRIFSICCVAGLLLFSLFASQIRAQAALPKAGSTGTAAGTATPTSIPGAEFTGAPLSGTAPLAVQFTDISPSILISCTWTFGDGSGLTVDPVVGVTFTVCPAASHTYTAAGSYTVSLSVMKATNGVTNKVTKTNYIQVSGPGTRTPTATPIMQYSFSGTVTNAVTGGPVSGAVVHIYQCHSSQSAQATTASNGTYSMTLPAQFFCDSSFLQVVASGYVTQTAWSFSASSPSNIVVNVALQPVGVATATPTLTATPTGACVPPTPESLRVSPVTSPTSATTQVITVTLHNGSSVTVTDEAGSFTSSTPTNSVFSVTVGLLANSTNHLQVQGTVTWSPNCPPYTLSTSVDTSGNPLTIVQGTGGSATSTPTRTPTPTPTATGGTACSPVTATIAAPFTKDGAGTFCWQSSNLGSYINSWNLANLTVNGVNFTNMYIPAANFPAKINGFWYVSYTSTVAWGHFEAK